MSLHRRHFLTGTAAAAAGLLLPTTILAPSAFAAEPRLVVTDPDSPSDQIKALQSLLNAYGIATDVDGSYGPATTANVKKYQTSKGLEVDGIAGPGTTKSLVGGSNTAVKSGWPNANTVKAVEHLLVLGGGKAADGSALPVNGTYDARDEELVKKVQTTAKLTVNGTVDYVTWTYLFNPPSVPAGPGASVMVTQMDGSTRALNNCGPAAVASMMLRMGVTPKYWSHGTGESVSALKDPDAVNYIRFSVLQLPDANQGTRGVSTSTLASRINAGTGINNATSGGAVANALSNVRSGGASMLSGDLKVSALWNQRPTGSVSHWVAILEYRSSDGKYRVCDPSAQGNKLVWVSKAELEKFATITSGFGNTSVLFPR